MVEVDISKDLPEEILLTTPYHELISQKVVYEWMPYYCGECHKLGHTKDFCRLTKAKKMQPTQVYQPVVAPPITASPPADETSACSELGPSASGKELQFSDLSPTRHKKGSECQELGSSSADGKQAWKGVKCIIRVKTGEGSLATSNRFDTLSEFAGLEVILLAKDRDISNMRNFLALHKPDIFGLLETHVKEHKAATILKKFANYKTICNYKDHYNGRIWVFWNPNTITVEKIHPHVQFIHCEVTHKATTLMMDVTMIYACNSATDREDLWAHLSKINLTADRWLTLGDFNMIRTTCERIGPNAPNLSEIMAFNDYIKDCSLEDLATSGREFSWTNKHHDGTRVWSRLDRAMVNANWLQAFPRSTATVLLPGLSDHSPLLINVFEEQRIRPHFSFLNCWAEHPNYLNLIKQGWASSFRGTVMYQFFRETWCSGEASAPGDLNLLAKENSLLARFKILKSAEIKMLHQRAKIQDIKLNDCPTSYFFAKMAKRRQQGIAGQICDHHGVLVQGVDKVNYAFSDYYSDFLGKAQPVQALDKELIAKGACLSSEDHLSLCAHVTPLEIKNALFSIGDNKSPGHDGFSARFFKTA
ncbi:uncharacterized protein LOC141632289 [Silene latifolia]|uniref:uncharacterized protein LOC141632289 n=1 Tax=Silene latifolia TaxID=37657 RepID=UPI003D773B8B